MWLICFLFSFHEAPGPSTNNAAAGAKGSSTKTTSSAKSAGTQGSGSKGRASFHFMRFLAQALTMQQLVRKVLVRRPLVPPNLLVLRVAAPKVELLVALGTTRRNLSLSIHQ